MNYFSLSNDTKQVGRPIPFPTEGKGSSRSRRREGTRTCGTGLPFRTLYAA